MQAGLPGAIDLDDFVRDLSGTAGLLTMQLPGMFRSLRIFNYRVWAVGALISNVGTWVQRTAQDWLVYTELTQHDASAVGVVMALQFAPQILFLPWTGSAADTFNQRKLLVATQAALGVLSLGLGLLAVTGVAQLWHVYVFAFLFGTAAAFDVPVRQTFVAELVGEGDLHNAVALNSTSFNAARMIGPAIAGILIAVVGTGSAFVFNGLSFGAVILSLMAMRAADLKPVVRAVRRSGGFVEGLKYVRARPELMSILVMLFLVGTFGLNFSIFIPTMAVKEFNADAAGYGLLTSIMAIGTVIGALLNAAREKAGPEMVMFGALGFGVGGVLAALAPNYWLFAAALVVMGISSLTVLNVSNSYMQVATEPAMRGRVMALRVGVALGGTPIGAPIVGWVANGFGPRWALAVGAAAGFAAALVGAWRMMRQSA